MRRSSSAALSIAEFDVFSESNQVILVDENDITSYITLQLLQEVNVVSDRAINKKSAMSLFTDRVK